MHVVLYKKGKIHEGMELTVEDQWCYEVYYLALVLLIVVQIVLVLVLIISV